MEWMVLMGVATGARSMTPIAVVCWAAWLGWLPLEGTWAFWAANLVSAIVFTVLAVGEWVGDTLPVTPKRTALGPLLARVFFGGLVGVMMATAMGQPKAGGIIFGEVGMLIGAYAGVRVRLAVSRWCNGNNWGVGLVESLLVLVVCMGVVGTVRSEIIVNSQSALLVWPSLR